MDMPCYRNAWWAATKESILQSTSDGKAHPRWPEETLKRHPKTSLKDFNIPPESWGQIALDRAKWCCLIRKGADGYEVKRICEVERKRKEHKALPYLQQTVLSKNWPNQQSQNTPAPTPAHMNTLRWSFSRLRDEPSVNPKADII